MNSWLTCIKKSFDFNGRAGRREYFVFHLFNTIILVLAMVFLVDVLGTVEELRGIGVLFIPLLMADALPSLGVVVRRLHDIGKSGWWMLVGLIPWVGPVVLFVLTVIDGQPGDNQYGPNPKMSPQLTA